jgi:hypothetical protein
MKQFILTQSRMENGKLQAEVLLLRNTSMPSAETFTPATSFNEEGSRRFTVLK